MNEFTITNEDLIKAEASRVKSLPEMLHHLGKMEKAVDEHEGQIHQLNQNQQAIYFGAWRIWLNIQNRRMQGWNFQEIEKIALVTSTKIRKILNPHTMRIAFVRGDPNNQNYPYGPEILRDIAAACFNYALIYGDSHFVRNGHECLKLAAHTEQGENPSAKQAHFEYLLFARIIHGEKIDWEEIGKAYNTAQKAAGDNTERRLTNAARLAGTWSLNGIVVGVKDVLKGATPENVLQRVRVLGRSMLRRPHEWVRGQIRRIVTNSDRTILTPFDQEISKLAEELNKGLKDTNITE